MNSSSLALLKLVMPLITWLLAAMLPGHRKSITRKEILNKLAVMELVTKNGAILPKTESGLPLTKLV